MKIHSELNDVFKVELNGKNLAATYKNGDLLGISNRFPGAGDDVLIKMRGGQHEIHRYSSDIGKRYSEEIMGPIKYRQISNIEKEKFDFSNCSKLDNPPDHCCSCGQLEILNDGGQVKACCLSQFGFKKVNRFMLICIFPGYDPREYADELED